MADIADARAALERHFGYPSFRPGQGEIIEAVLAGRDALAVMPTGAGKSVCYQVPAAVLPGLSIVVSPLISLMGDQVRALKDAGIRGSYLNSSLTARQQEVVMARAKAGTTSCTLRLSVWQTRASSGLPLGSGCLSSRWMRRIA